MADEAVSVDAANESGSVSSFELNVNGEKRAVRADGAEPLLYVLRNQLGLKGPRFGCGLGQCGACTVIVDGAAVRACITPVAAVGTRPVTTLEGLGSASHPGRMQRAFIAEQAAQCGYCINGMIMTAQALLARNPHPTEADVRQALADNLCRCGTHPRIVRAVLRAAGKA